MFTLGTVKECPHVVQLPRPEPAPLSEGCNECIAEGLQWVHLRLCLTCGHIGCCDSSPGHHASKHALGVDHPVIRSYEPGERWRWCYEDRILV